MESDSVVRSQVARFARDNPIFRYRNTYFAKALLRTPNVLLFHNAWIKKNHFLNFQESIMTTNLRCKLLKKFLFSHLPMFIFIINRTVPCCTVVERFFFLLKGGGCTVILFIYFSEFFVYFFKIKFPKYKFNIIVQQINKSLSVISHINY